MSHITLDCKVSHCECCKDFHIVYYKNGGKDTITAHLPTEYGYSIMQKKARMMPMGYMAQAVHPDDAHILLR
jgi:hypothetical protein